jgi:hypothetical protein
MGDTRWKAVERRFARDVGVQRIPVTGVDRDGADFADGIAHYQAKSRRTLPAWLWRWLGGIQETARHAGKIGVLVLHRPGQDRAEALVVLSWADWRALHGAAHHTEAR